jgi:DNA invertase Pin-like site-specific DNA recombinase
MFPANPDREPVLHPYARISEPAQRKGGGLKRQGPEAAEAIAAFAGQYGFAVAKRPLVDDGVSAFRGRHLSPAHALGKFLADAERGVVPPGDCLLIENWDRLSRQDVWAAVGLVNDLRQLGIHVGRLDRGKLLRCDSTDPGDFFEAAVELIRGHSESAAKSMRNGAAWKRKRKAARQDRAVITRRLPAWVGERDGRLHLLPGPAAAVRQIFALAGAGYGHLAILKRLVADGVPPFGKTGRWARSYLAKLLKDRRVLGEFQPCDMRSVADSKGVMRRRRVPADKPIPGFFPAAVTDEEFYAARAGADQRKRLRGRLGSHVNVFSGLLRSALDGDTYFVTTSFGARTRAGKGRGQRVLKNTACLEGRAQCRTFPLGAFERAALSRLREIDPHEILNGDGGPDETLTLGNQLAALEAEIAEAAAFMDRHGFSPAIGKRIVDLEARKPALAERLAAARQQAAHPLSETWGEAQTLIDAIATAPDPEGTRLRLRAALRRLVDEVRLLVVPRGADRLCLAQFWFKRDEPSGEERHRDYLILHRPPRANQSARTEGACRVGSCADVGLLADIDLRDSGHARRAEQGLLALDLAAAAALLEPV